MFRVITQAAGQAPMLLETHFADLAYTTATKNQTTAVVSVFRGTKEIDPADLAQILK